MKINMKSIFGVAAVLILGIAAVAFAHGGWGYGGHMMGPGYRGGYMMGPGYGGHMMGPGYGGHMMGWGADDGSYRRGYGAQGNLSDEDAAKLDASQEKFYQETRGLRDQIEEKSLALRDEMEKNNPDQAKIFALQKEISSLRSDFDQKAVSHQLEVRKMLPEDFRGSGHGYGYNRGYCR
jgi:Spy/CpxP family protein refolding chaperone